MPPKKGKGKGKGKEPWKQKAAEKAQESLAIRTSNAVQAGPSSHSQQVTGGVPQQGQDQAKVYNPSYTALPSSAQSLKGNTFLNSPQNKRSESEFPQRPAYGTGGSKPFELWTNHFELEIKPTFVAYCYRVKVEQVESRDVDQAQADSATQRVPRFTNRIKARMIQLFIELLHSEFKVTAVSDFADMLISAEEVPAAITSKRIQYLDQGETQAGPKACWYDTKIDKRKLLERNALLHPSPVRDANLFDDRQLVIQALNIILGYYAKTNSDIVTIRTGLHVEIGTDTDATQELGQELVALNAFAFSVRPAHGRALINVQVKTMPFYKPMSLEALYKILEGKDFSNDEVEAYLRGLKVKVNHLEKIGLSGKTIPRYSNIYGIARPDDGRGPKDAPEVERDRAGPMQVKFLRKPRRESDPSEGEMVTVFDHFKKKYLRTLNPKLPVLNTGSKKEPSYLPMEVCVIPPGQVFRRTLSDEQSKIMTAFAVRSPVRSAELICTSGFKLLGLEGNDTLAKFGIRVKPQLIKVPGRVLPPVSISYEKAVKTSVLHNSQMTVPNAVWKLEANRLLDAKGLKAKAWKVLNIAGGLEPSKLNECVQKFVETLRKLGMSVEHPGPIQSVKPNDVEAALRKGDCTFIVVILPKKDKKTLYDKIKHLCEIKFGILTQCISAKKFLDGRLEVYTNIGLKMNLKLGGRNQRLKDMAIGNVKIENTMFVGLDVTHPPPGASEDSKSIAGIVASTDSSLAHWPAAIRSQKGRQEKIDNLCELMKSRLDQWLPSEVPTRIVVYRDGVSEGQYPMVLRDELPEIKKAINESFAADRIPKLAIIIVGKRHHTRFYPTETTRADSLTLNTLPGTVVDRGVTEAGNWDFFLQAHRPLGGTAKPAHYYVVYDEGVFNAPEKAANPNGPKILTMPGQKAVVTTATDTLEQLTHSICYLFGRATKAVSYCPPAYYAHLVCDRAARYHAAEKAAGLPENLDLHKRIKDTMFYI